MEDFSRDTLGPMCNVKLKWVDLNVCVDQLKGELGVKKKYRNSGNSYC